MTCAVAAGRVQTGGKTLLAVECGSWRVPFLVTFYLVNPILNVRNFSNERRATLTNLVCSYPQPVPLDWALLSVGSGTVFAYGNATGRTMEVSFQGASSGQYVLHVTCMAAVWVSQSFILDFDAPLLSFKDKPPAVTTVQAPNFTLSAVDQSGLAYLQYSLCKGDCTPDRPLPWVLACVSNSGAAAAANVSFCRCSSENLF